MALSKLENPRVVWSALFVLTAIGAALRLWAAGWGPIADETNWIYDGGVIGNWRNLEAAVNPPGFRMLVAALASDPVQTLWIGRGLSVVASTATIPLMFLLGRAVGADRPQAGLIAACGLAFAPLAIQQAGWFRAYALLGLVLTWHLLALVQAATRDDRRWTVQLALSALLLPQVHYTTVPILLIEGLGFAVWRRDPRFVLAYVPSAVGFLPLAARIIAGREGHLAPNEAPVHTLLQLLTNQYGPLFPGLALVSVLLWKWADPRQRVLALSWGVAAGVLFAVSSYHMTRPDLGIVLVVHQIALIGALPGALPLPAADRSHLPWVLGLVLLLILTRGPFQWNLIEHRSQDGPPAVVAAVRAGDWPADRPTWVDPPHSIHPLYFLFHDKPLLVPCPVSERFACFDADEDHRFQALEHGAAAEPGWIVGFEPAQFPRFDAQCERRRTATRYVLWDCPEGYTPP